MERNHHSFIQIKKRRTQAGDTSPATFKKASMITRETFYPSDFIKKIPEGIYKLERKLQDGASFHNPFSGLFIIISGNIHEGKKWLHVSFSRKSRIPDYHDIKIIKHHFIGDDKKAIMIFPDQEHFVNIMPYCLHLFHCIDGDGLPEFSAEGLL